MHMPLTIIEFAGLPRSGKTTAATGLKKYMEQQGLTAHLVKERAGCCPIQDKLHPNFNLWTALSFLNEFLIARDKGIDYVIADRGIFDATIWIELLCSNGKYQQEHEAFKALQDIAILRDVKLHTFFLFCDIETALNREFERTLVRRPGRIMNHQMLSYYLQTYRQLSKKNSSCIEIDTTQLPISDMLSTIYKNINHS